jgi:protein-tyrosine phosphatase
MRRSTAVPRLDDEDPNLPVRREFLKGALRCFLLPALSSPWLVACGGTSDSVVAPTPRLASVNNFRDVAGDDDQDAYRTSSGKKLSRGVIYRSNVLTPSPSDLAILNTLDIVAVYDLRTPGEIAQTADILPQGASYLNINIAGTANTPTPILSSVAETVAEMEAAYQTFVTDSGTRGRLAQLFRALATTNGPQLYHCTGGKDRTGWATAVLLSLAGVSQDVVMQDYLLTNTYSAASIQAFYQAMVTAYGQAFADIYIPTQEAEESYLTAAFDQVTASYGSMTNYITNGLGLDASTQLQLINNLVA